ncbi:hypothetical protein M0R45_034229 [Rubus argutus]|uniref:1-phosphatidylinositol-4-phosphate 5-kinase n=1 Tax=Rubus argutus TaxID=59490 RepID=A0AAW1VQI0_RUBAR
MKIYLEMLPQLLPPSYEAWGLTISQTVWTSCLLAVFGSIYPSEICIHECYDLKGYFNRPSGKQVIVQERPLHKDLDFDLCFYLDPLVRARLLAQIKYDCEFLEAEGIMDYSLLLAVQVESPHEGGSQESFHFLSVNFI